MIEQFFLNTCYFLTEPTVSIKEGSSISAKTIQEVDHGYCVMTHPLQVSTDKDTNLDHPYSQGAENRCARDKDNKDNTDDSHQGNQESRSSEPINPNPVIQEIVAQITSNKVKLQMIKLSKYNYFALSFIIRNIVYTIVIFILLHNTFE